MYTAILLSLLNTQPCNDDDKVYKICQSQTVLYNKAIKEARATDKILLVTLGFESCKACINLDKTLKQNSYIGNRFLRAKIAIYYPKDHPASGTGEISSGKMVFDYLQMKAGKEIKWWFPTMVFVNPQTGKVLIRGAKDIEWDGNKPDQAQVIEIIKEAHLDIL